MTLHTEERLADRKKRVIGRAVGVVTVGTVFGHVGMLVDKRPLILHVAAGASRLDRRLAQHPLIHRPVGIVAIGAVHLVLVDRMMGDLRKLITNFRMAAKASLGHIVPAQFLL